MNSCLEEPPFLNEVPPISDEDRSCLKEVSQVLAKHGREKKFGVNLLHRHFSIAPDEVMVEDNDPINRTLTMTPRKADELGTVEYRETSWRLDTGQPMMNCICRVVRGAHSGDHVHTGIAPTPVTCSE